MNNRTDSRSRSYRYNLQLPVSHKRRKSTIDRVHRSKGAANKSVCLLRAVAFSLHRRTLLTCTQFNWRSHNFLPLSHPIHRSCSKNYSATGVIDPDNKFRAGASIRKFITDDRRLIFDPRICPWIRGEIISLPSRSR